jgi:SAM-dependent methyltransferase
LKAARKAAQKRLANEASIMNRIQLPKELMALILGILAFLPITPTFLASKAHAIANEANLDIRQDEKRKDKDATAAKQKEQSSPEPDVPYWPTPPAVVDKMLELAEVKKGDIVYDLGCGDGRILVTAAKKYGVKGFGFDIDPEQVKASIANVKENKVEDLVTIKKADIFTLDLKDASVVTLYLMPELNVRLMPQLEKLKPGSRIVSHDWDMKGAKPNKVVTLRAKNAMGLERVHKVYLWVVPWEKE